MLVLEQSGDSLSGTWTAVEGPYAGVERIVYGTFDGERFVARTEPFRVTGQRNGEAFEFDMSFSWEGRIEGDSIVGTMRRQRSGMEQSVDVWWSAHRGRFER